MESWNWKSHACQYPGSICFQAISRHGIRWIFKLVFKCIYDVVVLHISKHYHWNTGTLSILIQSIYEPYLTHVLCIRLNIMATALHTDSALQVIQSEGQKFFKRDAKINFSPSQTSFGVHNWILCILVNIKLANARALVFLAGHLHLWNRICTIYVISLSLCCWNPVTLSIWNSRYFNYWERYEM